MHSLASPPNLTNCSYDISYPVDRKSSYFCIIFDDFALLVLLPILMQKRVGNLNVRMYCFKSSNLQKRFKCKDNYSYLFMLTYTNNT